MSLEKCRKIGGGGGNMGNCKIASIKDKWDTNKDKVLKRIGMQNSEEKKT